MRTILRTLIRGLHIYYVDGSVRFFLMIPTIFELSVKLFPFFNNVRPASMSLIGGLKMVSSISKTLDMGPKLIWLEELLDVNIADVHFYEPLLSCCLSGRYKSDIAYVCLRL